MLQGDKALLANQLFDIAAIEFGDFKLKLHETHPDAPLSPIYVNLRDVNNPKPGKLTAIEYELGAALMCDLIYGPGFDGPGGFDLLAGIPNAGDPWVEALAAAIKRRGMGEKPTITLIKETTDSGRKISGVSADSHYGERDIVLLIDDLITKADTKLEAVEALEAKTLLVNDLIVLVDRQQGGTEELASRGIHVHSVFTLRELLDHYVDTGRITAEKAAEVIDYLAHN